MATFEEALAALKDGHEVRLGTRTFKRHDFNGLIQDTENGRDFFNMYRSSIMSMTEFEILPKPKKKIKVPTYHVAYFRESLSFPYIQVSNYKFHSLEEFYNNYSSAQINAICLLKDCGHPDLIGEKEIEVDD